MSGPYWESTSLVQPLGIMSYWDRHLPFWCVLQVVPYFFAQRDIDDLVSDRQDIKLLALGLTVCAERRQHCSAALETCKIRTWNTYPYAPHSLPSSTTAAAAEITRLGITPIARYHRRHPRDEFDMSRLGRTLTRRSGFENLCVLPSQVAFIMLSHWCIRSKSASCHGRDAYPTHPPESASSKKRKVTTPGPCIDPNSVDRFSKPSPGPGSMGEKGLTIGHHLANSPRSWPMRGVYVDTCTGLGLQTMRERSAYTLSEACSFSLPFSCVTARNLTHSLSFSLTRCHGYRQAEGLSIALVHSFRKHILSSLIQSQCCFICQLDSAVVSGPSLRYSWGCSWLSLRRAQPCPPQRSRSLATALPAWHST